MKKFTKEKLLKLRPCYGGLSFADSCDFDFDRIWKTCERGDWLIWLLQKNDNIDKPAAVKIAIACAEHVLAKFEKKCPNDGRPRKAIEAAIEWVRNPIEENRKAAATAATTAYAAAATTAAYAAAYAAYAAATAYAATYTAYAATAADAAAADAIIPERKWQADKIREIIPNPF